MIFDGPRKVVVLWLSVRFELADGPLINLSQIGYNGVDAHKQRGIFQEPLSVTATLVG